MQIINLIYIRNGPIERDEKFIGKSCGLTKGKAGKIVCELLELGEIYLTEESKISQKRCDLVLFGTRNRMEEYSKNGKKGAKARWKNEENQELENGGASSSMMASISTNTSIENHINTNSARGEHKRMYDIDQHLGDDARQRARECAPRWDQQVLMQKYNDWINSGKGIVPENPNSAYPSWCKKYTGGKSPD